MSDMSSMSNAIYVTYMRQQNTVNTTKITSSAKNDVVNTTVNFNTANTTMKSIVW